MSVPRHSASRPCEDWRGEKVKLSTYFVGGLGGELCTLRSPSWDLEESPHPNPSRTRELGARGADAEVTGLEGDAASCHPRLLGLPRCARSTASGGGGDAPTAKKTHCWGLLQAHGSRLTAQPPTWMALRPCHETAFYQELPM